MPRRAKDDSAVMPRTGSFDEELDDEDVDARELDGDLDSCDEVEVEINVPELGRMRSKSADSVMGMNERDDDDEDNTETQSETAKQRRRSTAETFRKSFMRSSFRRRRRSSSVGSSGQGLDPAFVEDIRQSLLEYSRIIQKRQGVGSGLYATPETTHDWGQKQKEHRVNWADLFMDLVFVGTAFQEGKLISDTLLTKRWIGFFYFYTTFAVLHECWSLKLHFSSRFNSDDIAHKIFDIFEVLIVALMAGHLSVTVADFEDSSNSQLLGVVSCKVAHQFFHLLRWLELYAYSDKVIVRRQSEAFSAELLLGSIPLLGALALVVMRFDAVYVSLCLSASTIFEVGLELSRALYLRQSDKVRLHAVPMHIEYCTHRYGEWTMLMLGEGVMQIIIVNFDQMLERYLTFVPAYLLMAALRILYYSSQPFKAQGHALNQSVRRGFIWLQLQPVESSLIVCVGIGLKELLKNSYAIGKPEYAHYTWFFCISTSSLLVLVWLASFLHNGLHREFLSLPPRIRNLKLFTYTGNFMLSLALLVVVPFHLKSYVVVSVALGICTLQVFTHDLWHRISKENESDEKYLRSLHLVNALSRPLARTAAARTGPSDDESPAAGGSAQVAPGVVAIMEKHRQRIEESFKHTFSFGSMLKSEDAVPHGIRVNKPQGRSKKGQRHEDDKDAVAEEEEDDYDEEVGEQEAVDNVELERHLLRNPELQADLLDLMHRYPHHDIQDGLRVLIKCNASSRKKTKLRKSRNKARRHRDADKKRGPDAGPNAGSL
ncbi:Hypothetical Protein FCC1311_013322 [Hondaea fermentalgiana]|uniref:Uncharacterized protein n=1 Tax=Hondaea fermentalgiana TaxID=2315210 RepID=A0A2R5GBJ8_9STRA|nr:Hypothetical Protein FCC1311_013322 [Hondaea fermentalgiana]|eukprot:GBG25114.1 Hypothetical Protein FCC1311_013322 [Hondaea fermentalgiana]